MAARRKRNRQRRRRGRFGFLYKLLSFLVIFTALVVGCVVFFRVNEVTVTGNRRYTVREVVAASKVELGDNLLLVNKPQTVRNIARQLPYVETVAPIRRLPDTLELRITETTAAARIQTEDGWWLINAGGKLVELGGEELRPELPEVIGLTPILPTLGAKLTVGVAEQTRLEGLKSLLTALEGQEMLEGLGSFVDLSATNVIRFAYGEQLTVAVPMSGDFERRVFSLRRSLETLAEQGEQAVGTLDLTYGDDQARLLTDRWLPERYRPREDPQPDETGEEGPEEAGQGTAEPAP